MSASLKIISVCVCEVFLTIVSVYVWCVRCFSPLSVCVCVVSELGVSHYC